MPHAFLNTKLTPLDFVEKWQERSFLLENVRIKIRQGFGNTENLRAIFPCFVMEPQHKNWFYIEVCRKGQNQLFIHIDSITPILRTAGVRLALTWFTQNLAAMDENSQIDERNLASYFKLLKKKPIEQNSEFAKLQQKLASQIRAAIRREQSKKYAISLAGRKPPFKFEKIFGNLNPIEIEIGPGKGKFILNEAQKNPNKNFLAIEWAGRYLKDLSERIPLFEIENIRLLDADARDMFNTWISDQTVSVLHIYYPDPWWKRKHKKHKLFTDEFLKNMERVLINDGIFKFVTDVKEVYLELQKLIKAKTDLKLMDEKKYQTGKEPPPGRTNFEIKKWQKGCDIFEAKWQKVSG